MNEKLAITLLSIIYLVGLVGIGFDIDPRLIFLTPLNLLISMIVISLYDTSGWKTFAVFAALIFSLGYVSRCSECIQEKYLANIVLSLIHI